MPRGLPNGHFSTSNVQWLVTCSYSEAFRTLSECTVPIMPLNLFSAKPLGFLMVDNILVILETSSNQILAPPLTHS
jgi:hypothetical protein